MASIPTYFLGIASLLLPSIAYAQPGATPPGSVPPDSPERYPDPAPYPEPAPYPQPAPYPEPAPAPNYSPDYGPRQQPMPPPQNQEKGRHGWNIGFSGALGSMSSNLGELECQGCESTPPAIGAELHFGTMVIPKLALQAEVWFMTRDLDDNGDSSLDQQLFMLTAQYWLVPKLWIKAGVGVSNLSVSYFDGFEQVDESLESGTALMAAIGYELLQSGRFALDLQLKTGRGLYSEREEEITTNVLALGFNWY
jgi:hypothetical protein